MPHISNNYGQLRLIKYSTKKKLKIARLKTVVGRANTTPCYAIKRNRYVML